MTSPLHTQGGESAPTPTPWKVQGNFIGGEVAAIVEMAQSSLTTYEEKRANLALIVQAVNERPALLAQAAHHSAQLEKSLGRIAQLEGALRSAKADAYAEGFTAHALAMQTEIPEPSNPSLWRYLENAHKKQITFHTIGVNRMPDGGYHFYIHPQSVSGETEDFLVWPDPFNWQDMIVNRKDSPAPDVEKFKAALRALHDLPANALLHPDSTKKA